MRVPHFFPVSGPFVAAFFFSLVLVFVALQIGLIEYAYERLGLSQGMAFLLLLASLLGSAVNIPLTRVGGGRIINKRTVAIFGVRYIIPVVEHEHGTILAVNLGGAVIPTLISAYLFVHMGGMLLGLASIAIVSATVHTIAKPVPGLGIAVPIFIPPVVAAVVALLLAPAHAPAVAYVAGTMGSLVGADLLNLHRLTGLGAPIASIGGAGTFDGIFLTGILAVLLT